MNFSDDSSPEYVDESMIHLDYTAHVIVMPVILYVGFVGQLLNLITLSQPLLRGISYVYLKAIASSDLLSILCLIPFVLRHADAHLKHCYLSMWYHAHLEIPLINAFLGASTLCIVGLTLERYISVCHPVLSHHRTNTTNGKRTKWLIFCLFCLSFLICAPGCLQKKLVSSANKENVTEYAIVRNSDLHDTSVFKAYLIIREVTVRLGPIVLLIVLNTAILWSFRKVAERHRRLQNRSYQDIQSSSSNYNLTSPSPTPRNGGDEKKDFYDKEWRLYILLVVTVVIFVVCTLPASILSLAVTKIPALNFEFQVFRAGANLLEVLSYSINFYIYCLCSREYRSAFLLIIKCSWTGQRRQTSYYGRTNTNQLLVPAIRNPRTRSTTPV